MWWIGLSLLFMYVHLKHRLKRRPWISFCLSKDRALEMQVVVNLAEWLRRETWNLMGSPAQVQILQLTSFFSFFSLTTFSRILWLEARSIIRDSMLLLIVDVNFVYYLSLKCLFLRCLGSVFLAWCALFNPPFCFLKPYIFNDDA